MAGSAGMKRTYAIGAVVFVVMLALGIFTGGQLNDRIFESVQTKDSKGKVINILVMGVDARNARDNTRSDTMILASLDPATKQVVMISIPRDTRIKNARGQNDRINSINWLQGPEAACKEVGKLLNVDVDYYVITNFGGFGDIVDALGGVHIDVETNMYHADPVNPELAINLKKGYQYLNGKQALAFVRYRGGPTADIGRTENQQKFIKALAAEMLQTKTILRLPQLIPELYENVRTNLPLQDMIHLANMAPDLELDNIATQTLPGYSFTDPITGASYWEADKKMAKTLIADLKSGAEIKVVQEAPPGAKPAKMVVRPEAEVEPSPITAPVAENGEGIKDRNGEPGAAEDEETDGRLPGQEVDDLDDDQGTDPSSDEEGPTDPHDTDTDDGESGAEIDADDGSAPTPPPVLDLEELKKVRP